MWPFKTKVAPLANVETLVSQDKCPKCRGELDTGWECNNCGFDARPIALTPIEMFKSRLTVRNE